MKIRCHGVVETGLGLKVFLLLLMFGFLAGWAPYPAGAADGVIRISGGTAHIPVMKAAARVFMEKHPGVRITIAGGGSGVGIKQVGEGLVDIGNSGRRPTEREIEKYGLVLHRWALDGVGVIVNRDNPVRKLTRQQLKSVFSGRISNWRELGGVDHEITLCSREAGSGTRKVFWKKALEKGDISDRAQVVPSNGAMKIAVAGNPYAIGYISVGYLDGSVAGVALDGVAPTLENVKSGRYPVVRGLYSNTKGPARGLVKEFIDLLYSPVGEKIISGKGLLPVER